MPEGSRILVAGKEKGRIRNRTSAVVLTLLVILALVLTDCAGPGESAAIWTGGPLPGHYHMGRKTCYGKA